LTDIAIEDYFFGKSGFAPAYGYKYADPGAKATVNERGNGFTIDFGDAKLAAGEEKTFTYTVVFPANMTRADVDWNNIATVTATATPEDGGARVSYSDDAKVTQPAGAGSVGRPGPGNDGSGSSPGSGAGGSGEKGIGAGKGGGEKGTVTGGGGEKITSPGGNDPTVPPRPTSPNNSLIPGPNGTYIEIDENGARIGEWYWDDLTAQWIFGEYPPLGVLPKTGATPAAGADGHARGETHMILPAVRKEAEDSADNGGAAV
jgi:hypothetical protein